MKVGELLSLGSVVVITLILVCRRATADQYYFKDRMIPQDAEYALSGYSARLVCRGAEKTMANKIVPAHSYMFVWSGPKGLPCDGPNYSIEQQGYILVIKKCETVDSGEYTCSFTAKEIFDAKSKFKLTVYDIPTYKGSLELIYYGTTCNGLLTKIVKDSLQGSYCVDMATCTVKIGAVNCNYGDPDGSGGSFLGYFQQQLKQFQSNNSMAIIKGVVEFLPGKDYYIKTCDLRCVFDQASAYYSKKNYPQYASKVSATILEQTGFKMAPLVDVLVEAMCRPGFEVYNYEACVPCEPGMYSNNHTKCQECGKFHYQDSFGSKSCIKCPFYGIAHTNRASNETDCKPFYKSQLFIVGTCVGTVVLIVGISYILLHCGFCPCIYRPDMKNDEEREQEIALSLKRTIPKWMMEKHADETKKKPAQS